MFPKALRWLLDAMAAVASETFTSTSAPIQYAAVTAFEGGPEIDSYLRRVRRVLGALGPWCAERLRRSGARSPSPVGGFYLFPDLSPLRERLAKRGIHGSAELCKRLLDDTGVAILPGSAFGRPDEELTARIAYVNFDGGRAIKRVAAMDDGVALDEAFLRRHCGGVLTAFERMCSWLDAD
jgi:aspartate aminotransferase